MVALQSAILSSVGGTSRSSCARAKAAAGVGGSGGERCEERDMLGLPTMLEGAVFRPGDRVWLPQFNRTLIMHANVYDQDQGLTGRYHNTTLQIKISHTSIIIQARGLEGSNTSARS